MDSPPEASHPSLSRRLARSRPAGIRRRNAATSAGLLTRLRRCEPSPSNGSRSTSTRSASHAPPATTAGCWTTSSCRRSAPRKSPSSPAPGRPAPFACSFFTGARRNEVLEARWEWVNVERGTLSLPDSKTGGKTIHLNAPALNVLAGLPRLDSNRSSSVEASLARDWTTSRHRGDGCARRRCSTTCACMT